ncbi:type II secretion system protein GspN [uncultured Desulfuromusa sp.]|uniref:type II secretion system protein GspN n=1 Tax=uncultured Desulfuromusa sp. TaxID=219183 RepID=UPI002AA70A68|nr:type II secretion system protein GspN [uncultured Desulfuromusa sp.]
MKYTVSTLFNKSKIILLTLILFSLGLFAGILFSFPEAKVKQIIISSLETQGQVSVTQGDINISLFGIDGSNLQIQPENPLLPTIPIKSLAITPHWLSLLSKNPGGHLDMQLFDGTLTADIYRDGTLNLAASELNLASLSLTDQTLTITGQLAEMSLSSVVPLQKTSDSLISLSLKDINIARNSDLKLAINLGDIVINGTGRGRAFKITSLQAAEGDLAISGRGRILLGKSLPSSKINLKMEIRPQETADPMIVELLQLGTRKTADGSYELSLSGSLSDL